MSKRSEQFAITLAQLNPTVGDVEGNAAKARAARAQAHADGADLVLLPELFIAGYPPEDLVLKPAFQSACRAAIEALARETADGGPAMTQALRALRDDPELRAALAKNGLETIRERHTCAHRVDELLAIVARLKGLRAQRREVA